MLNIRPVSLLISCSPFYNPRLQRHTISAWFLGYASKDHGLTYRAVVWYKSATLSLRNNHKILHLNPELESRSSDFGVFMCVMSECVVSSGWKGAAIKIIKGIRVHVSVTVQSVQVSLQNLSKL